MTQRRPLVMVSGIAQELASGDALPPLAGFGTATAPSAYALDLSSAQVFYKTMAAASALTLTNIPASGLVVAFILELTNGGTYAPTWWSGIKWAGGTAPTLTASGTDVLGFYSRDGGSTWRGFMLAKDSK